MGVSNISIISIDLKAGLRYPKPKGHCGPFLTLAGVDKKNCGNGKQWEIWSSVDCLNYHQWLTTHWPLVKCKECVYQSLQR